MKAVLLTVILFPFGLTPTISFAKPNQDITTEVLIIGGGTAGLTTAYKLLNAGKKIVLTEDGFIGSGKVINGPA